MKKLLLCFSIMSLAGVVFPAVAARHHGSDFSRTIIVDPRNPFRTASILRSLGISFEKNPETKQFYCLDCKYTSSYKQNMACHIFSHLNIKVQCGLCGGAMPRSFFVNKHKKSCVQEHKAFIVAHRNYLLQQEKLQEEAANVLCDLSNLSQWRPIN